MFYQKHAKNAHFWNLGFYFEKNGQKLHVENLFLPHRREGLGEIVIHRGGRSGKQLFFYSKPQVMELPVQWNPAPGVLKQRPGGGPSSPTGPQPTWPQPATLSCAPHGQAPTATLAGDGPPWAGLWGPARGSHRWWYWSARTRRWGSLCRSGAQPALCPPEPFPFIMSICVLCVVCVHTPRSPLNDNHNLPGLLSGHLGWEAAFYYYYLRVFGGGHSFEVESGVPAQAPGHFLAFSRFFLQNGCFFDVQSHPINRFFCSFFSFL